MEEPASDASYAWSAAQSASADTTRLAHRVVALENKIEELVDAINHLAVHSKCVDLDDIQEDKTITNLDEISDRFRAAQKEVDTQRMYEGRSTKSGNAIYQEAYDAAAHYILILEGLLGADYE